MSKHIPFDQLELKFRDTIQRDYESIRPVVLFAEPIKTRSDETGIARGTLSDKARKFVVEGMLGLVDQRTQIDKKVATSYPEPVARYILYLKQLYPPIHYREIVRIVGRKYGYKTNHHTVKKFLDRHPTPVQMELNLQTFHSYEDAYEARWQVVSLYHEGWSKKSIAGLLKLSHVHVGRLIKAFAEQGFDALEDKRTRPANHPHNQMTLPFMEKVYEIQQDNPRQGRFRNWSILEMEMGDDTPSESTVGRAMAFNRVLRGAPPPYPTPEEKDEEEKSFPYRPYYRHQYWYIDIRYLVKIDEKWVYSICIIEGYSRKILAGAVTQYQDELAVLQLLYAALSEYDTPWGIVSDNGSVFTAEAFTSLLAKLEIEPCLIEARKPWQNLIEAQFKVQSRMADHKFEEATTLEEVEGHHATFIYRFNNSTHWAHKDRYDGCTTPVTVLGWKKGRKIDLRQFQSAFRELQFTRTVNRYGSVSVQRFYIYAERGLSRKRVSIWIYEDRLNIEHDRYLLARYRCKVDRKSKTLKQVSQPELFRTIHADPQITMFELDDEEWLKVLERPYTRRKRRQKTDLVQLSWLNQVILVIVGRF